MNEVFLLDSMGNKCAVVPLVAYYHLSFSYRYGVTEQYLACNKDGSQSFGKSHFCFTARQKISVCLSYVLTV